MESETNGKTNSETNNRKEMRIGILTYHRAHNYGAVLQCYALQTYLRTLGHDAFVVDYRPSYFHYGLFVWYKWISKNPYKLFLKIRHQLKTFGLQRRRLLGFDNFIEKVIVPQRLNLRSTKSGVDCFVFGSDQIWRKNGGAFDPVFFGGFRAAQGARLVSYAASMGQDALTEDESKQLSEWLSHFDALTVRETSLQALLSPLTEKSIDVVVDPTLLFSHKEWDKIAQRPPVSQPYVLVYQVIDNAATLQMAQEAANSLSAEVIVLASKVYSKRETGFRTIYDATPQQFVGWIANAAMVVTTSFHGTAFSIIYRKPFVCVRQHLPSDLRLCSVLETFGLQDRFLDCNAWTWRHDYLKEPVPTCDAIEHSKELLNLVFSK